MNRPLHEALWLSCSAKRCCALRTVVPTGADIWRIATTLQIEPESFLRSTPAPDADDGFILSPGAQPLYAALARRSSKGRTASCVFLMQLDDTTTRCGLGGLRPLRCQTFPADGTSAVRCADDAQVCTCRHWTLADIDRGLVLGLLKQDAYEREQYRQVINSWNALVTTSPANSTFSFRDFCRYILSRYRDNSTYSLFQDT